jgi:hypothetical protein
MANLIVLDTGKENFLKILADESASEKLDTLWVGLYVNNYTPVHDDVFSDYSEATFSGYARAQIVTLTAVSLNGSNQGQSTTNALVFANSTGANQDVYGIFIVDTNGSVHDLLCAGRFDAAPVSIPAGGDLGIVLTFLTDSLF